MKINRITGLISSLAGRAELGTQAVASEAPEAEAAAQGDSEAASVAADFGVDPSEAAARKDKIERLKAQVKDGAYRPDSREVATAVLKELGSL